MNKENNKTWFVSDGTRVTGPYSAEEVQTLAQQGLAELTMIWDGLNSVWCPLKMWLEAHPNPKQEAWFAAVQGTQSGPYPLKDLLEKIKSQEIPLSAKFWTEGLKEWVTLSDLPQIIEGAGLLRRKTPRVPFIAEVEVRGLPHPKPPLATSISEGGLGIRDLLELGKGSRISLKIVSAQLSEPLETRAEIVNQTSLESALRFHNLTERARLAVREYVQGQKKIS